MEKKLSEMTYKELALIAKDLNIKVSGKKVDLINDITKARAGVNAPKKSKATHTVTTRMARKN